MATQRSSHSSFRPPRGKTRVSHKGAFPREGTALITGASSGIGAAYADYVASEGMDLILCARSVDKLEAKAAELRQQYGRRVNVLPIDLNDRQARAELPDRIAQAGEHVDVFINNAGFGTRDYFVDIDPERIDAEIELNCVALAHLTRLFLPGMVERQHGAIINVASVVSFYPLPTMAIYAATKAFVLSFTNALWAETRGTGVRVVAICPGATDTNFFNVAGNGDEKQPGLRSPQDVVQSTFAALDADKHTVIDGGGNTVATRLSALTPKRLVMAIGQRLMGPKK